MELVVNSMARLVTFCDQMSVGKGFFQLTVRGIIPQWWAIGRKDIVAEADQLVT